MEVEGFFPPLKRQRLDAGARGSHAVPITEARGGGEVVDLTESEGEEEVAAAGGEVSAVTIDLTKNEPPVRCSTPVLEEEEEEEKDDLDATLDSLGLSQQSVGKDATTYNRLVEVMKIHNTWAVNRQTFCCCCK